MIFPGTMTCFKLKRIMAFSVLPLVTALCLLSPGQLLGAENWYERGLSLSKAKRYQEAVEAFTIALKTNPRHADAYNNRGIAWYNLGAGFVRLSDCRTGWAHQSLFVQ